MRHRLALTVTVLSVSLLAACGGHDSTSGTPPTTAASTPATPAGSTPATTAYSAPATTAGSSPATTAASAPATTAGSSPGTPVIDPGDGGHYTPQIDPANFVATVDNPYMPWIVGSRWIYRGRSEGERERTVIVVTDRHKTVMDIDA